MAGIPGTSRTLILGEVYARPLAGGGIALYGSTSGYVGFKPAAIAGNTIWQLPIADGTAGQAIVTNGSGTLSFADAGVTDHGALSGLTDDDHVDYARLIGRTGGQALIGGLAAGENLTLQTTSHATKGKVLFGTSAYDEVNNRLGIGTLTPSEKLQVVGSGIFSGNVSVADEVYSASWNGSLQTPTKNAVYDKIESLPTSTGDVSKVGTPVDNQIGVWTGDGTIEGDANFTWSGTEFSIKNANTLLVRETASIIESRVYSAVDTDQNVFRFYRSYGTAASPQFTSGTNSSPPHAGYIQFIGRDSNAPFSENVQAQISLGAGGFSGNGSWNSVGRSTTIRFYTTDTNSTVMAQRWSIRPDGSLAAGADGGSNFRIDQGGSIYNIGEVSISAGVRMPYYVNNGHSGFLASDTSVLAAHMGHINHVRIDIDNRAASTNRSFIVGHDNVLTSTSIVLNVLFSVHENGGANLGYSTLATPVSMLDIKALSPNRLLQEYKAASAQSEHMVNYVKSDGTLYHSISENGYQKTKKNAAPADGELDPSECAYWFDATNGAPVFNLKGKTADGTVVTGTVAMS